MLPKSKLNNIRTNQNKKSNTRFYIPVINDLNSFSHNTVNNSFILK